MEDQATMEAIRLVGRADLDHLTTDDHRLLRELARKASEESIRDYWPLIWGDFAERFDPR